MAIQWLDLRSGGSGKDPANFKQSPHPLFTRISISNRAEFICPTYPIIWMQLDSLLFAGKRVFSLLETSEVTSPPEETQLQRSEVWVLGHFADTLLGSNKNTLNFSHQMFSTLEI